MRLLRRAFAAGIIGAGAAGGGEEPPGDPVIVSPLNMTANDAPSPFVASSSSDFDSPIYIAPWRVFAGVTETNFGYGWMPAGGLGWLMLDLGASTVFDSVQIACAFDDEAPLRIKVHGSNLAAPGNLTSNPGNFTELADTGPITRASWTALGTAFRELSFADVTHRYVVVQLADYSTHGGYNRLSQVRVVRS